jgi:putative spermidine/putrescine transport system permease protein
MTGRIAQFLLYTVVGLVFLWLVAPTLVIIPMSFNANKSLAFPPVGFSVQWYANLFQSADWMRATWQSVQISTAVALVSTVLGTLAALGLARVNRRIAGWVRAFLLAPMIVPVVVIAIGIYAVFLDLGLVGTYTGFVLAQTMLAVPFVVVTVSASLEVFDARLLTAAQSLGAGPVQAFQTVTLPLIAPGVISGALFAFVTSFDELVISLFLNSPYVKPLAVQIYSSITRDSDPTVAAAGTLIFVATTAAIALALLFSRLSKDR